MLEQSRLDPADFHVLGRIIGAYDTRSEQHWTVLQAVSAELDTFISKQPNDEGSNGFRLALEQLKEPLATPWPPTPQPSGSQSGKT